MRQPRIRTVAGKLLVALCACAAIRCASPPRPIGPGDTLRPNEGLLVLHVRTETPLRTISVGGEPLPFAVGRGTHLRLMAVSAGRYRWSGLGLPANWEDSRQPGTVQVSFRDVAELSFSVEAGRVNYAGMLEVYDYGHHLVRIRSVDRTALAIEELHAQFPTWLDQFPIVYAGPGRNVFLDRYLAVKGARNRAGESTGQGSR